MGPLGALEAATDDAALTKLWLRGGFPDSFLARSDEESLFLRKDFIRTYLERDVPQFGPRLPAETLERLWTMLAHSQGTLLNASRLAAGLSVSPCPPSFGTSTCSWICCWCGDCNRSTRCFVVYSGSERYNVSAEVEAIGPRELTQMLASAA
jgi:hypothetical protein